MLFFHKISLKYLIFFLLLILVNCKLQEPFKTHGIVYLDNRADKLIENKSNKNDVIKILGQPQVVEDKDKLTWIYVERIFSKGKYHKLGQNILKENNVLILNFDKYGILESKVFYDKEKMKKIEFSEQQTEHSLTQKSFVEKFLQSIKQKMYGK